MQSFCCYHAARCLGIAGELPIELLSRQIARLYGPDVLNKEVVRKCNGILSFIDDAIGSGEIDSCLIEVPIILEKVQVVTVPDSGSFWVYSRKLSHDYERTVYETENLHPALLPEATKSRTEHCRRSSNQRSYVIATRKDVITKRLISAVDFAAWPNKPPIPEGEAGELIRAWLSLATVEVAAASESVPGEAVVVALATGECKAKRRATREDALHPFIDEAVREWRSKHNGGWPLPADVLRILRRDYANGSDCGTISRVTEDGIEWRPPTATAEKSHGGEALRKRLERMRQKFRNAGQSRTDDMDDCA